MPSTAPKRRARTKAPGVYRSVSGRYEIAYTDSDGRQRFKTVSDRFEDAKALRAEIVDKLAKGEPVRHSRQTFEEYARTVVAALNKRPRTIEKHNYNLKAHLLPRFRRKRLGDITTNDVARLVAEMERKGFSGWTIAATLSTLSTIMRKARREGLIAANPVSDLEREERPKIDSGEKRALDEKEIARLLAKSTDTFRPLIATMVFTGVRLGEALGLTWADVDFASGHVHVRYQLDRKRERVPVKTNAGRRSVVLTLALAKVLREHKRRSPHSRDVDFVFAAPDGRGRDHRSTGRGIERAVAAAKLGEGVSSHTFRHTFASMLIVGLNYDPVQVSKQLGHTKASFTQDVYTHLFDKARHAAKLRDELEQGFGHLLADVMSVSNSGRNQAKSSRVQRAALSVVDG